MKKLLSVLLASLLLFGCTSAKPLEWNSLSILSPKGAPAVALVPLVQNGTDTIEFVDGADLLSAELVKGEYDVIVAPVNLGAMLYSKGNEAYKLYGVLTWGNLYIVGTEVQPAIYPLNIALFGDKAVPGIVYNKLKGASGDYNGTFFNAVSDVQAQLLTSQYTLGLLAEPLVTATIAKAKESGVNLVVVEDLQQTWFEQTGFDNYPQAGLFVKADLTEEQLAQVAARFESMQSFVASADTDASTVVEPINTIGAAVLGVPSGELVKAAWEGLNISVVSSTEAKDSVEAFLEMFNLNGLEIYSSK
jgi:NitT/TauT family transport system substrate-binding protein